MVENDILPKLAFKHKLNEKTDTGRRPMKWLQSGDRHRTMMCRAGDINMKSMTSNQASSLSVTCWLH